MTALSLEQHFMDIASERLTPDTFAQLLASAQERTSPDQPRHIPVPKRFKVDKPFLQERVGQSFVDSLPPIDKVRELQDNTHVAMRLEERIGLKVSASDLGELGQLVRRGGHQVRTLRTQIQTITHSEVHWRGLVFVVLFNTTRNELITAYQFKPARPPTHKGVRFPAEKARKRLGIRDVHDDDIDLSEE